MPVKRCKERITDPEYAIYHGVDLYLPCIVLWANFSYESCK